MAEIIEGIHPTRMELLNINNRVILAEKGHRLLREKRDSLIAEFFKQVSKARGSRDELIQVMDLAYRDLIKAEAIMGSSVVENIASSTPELKEIDLSIRNIAGVKMPQMSVKKSDMNREYSVISTSSKLDDAVMNFSFALNKIVKFAEVEEGIRRLGDEIEKTKRRVNALEYIVIPRLKNTQRYIKMRLDELERESFYRLKMVKKKRVILG